MLKGSFLHHAVRFFEGILCEKMKKTAHSLKCCVENKFGDFTEKTQQVVCFPSLVSFLEHDPRLQCFLAEKRCGDNSCSLRCYIRLPGQLFCTKKFNFKKKQQYSNRANGCVAQEIAGPPKKLKLLYLFFGGSLKFFLGSLKWQMFSIFFARVFFLVREIETFSTL